MSMIKIVSPEGKTINTDSCDEIQRLLELEGIPWFEALRKPVNVSEEIYQKIDILVTPP